MKLDKIMSKLNGNETYDVSKEEAFALLKEHFLDKMSKEDCKKYFMKNFSCNPFAKIEASVESPDGWTVGRVTMNQALKGKTITFYAPAEEGQKSGNVYQCSFLTIGPGSDYLDKEVGVYMVSKQ